MKIKKIHFYERSLGLNRPYSIAYKTVTEVKNAIVELHLANGIIGIGSANPSPQVVGETVDEVLLHLRSADFTFLENRSIHEFEAILKETHVTFGKWPGTRAALDIALHDAYTQYLKIPLVTYFGQEYVRLPTSVTIGIKDMEETLEEAAEYVGRGFSHLKVKTGRNAESDAERVVKIHERFPGITIRVDANQGYQPKDLVQFLKYIENTPLELIEQPFHVDRFEEFSSGLTSEASEYLVADESLKNALDAIQLLNNVSNCHVFNIKLMKSGGIKEAREIAAVARHADISLMWGCNDESRVSISAALHTALSTPSTKYIDLDGSLDLAEDVVEKGFILKDGVMSVTDQPGLGVHML